MCEGSGRIYLKWWKRKTYNQDYSIQQDLIRIWWWNQKLYRQAIAKKIQQGSSNQPYINVKGTLTWNTREKDWEEQTVND